VIQNECRFRRCKSFFEEKGLMVRGRGVRDGVGVASSEFIRHCRNNNTSQIWDWYCAVVISHSYTQLTKSRPLKQSNEPDCFTLPKQNTLQSHVLTLRKTTSFQTLYWVVSLSIKSCKIIDEKLGITISLISPGL
jgi:hypothetical protein